MAAVFSCIFIGALLIFAIGTAVTDTIWRKIPNKFTVPFAALGLIFSLSVWGVCLSGAVTPLPVETPKDYALLATYGSWNFDVMFTYLAQINPLWAIAGFFVGFFILFLPAALGGMGFGDVKLLAALGIWLGVKWFLLVFVMAILLACLLSVCVIVVQGPLKYMRRMRSMTKIGAKQENQPGNPKDKKRRNRNQPKELKRIIPFAIPTAAAVVLFVVMFAANTFQNVPVFYH